MTCESSEVQSEVPLSHSCQMALQAISYMSTTCSKSDIIPCFTLKENNIRVIAPQAFSGVPNLDTLDLSKNKLDDESFSQNPLSVSNTTLCAYHQSPNNTAVCFFAVSLIPV